MTNFVELGVPAQMVSELSRRGVTEPFPIQAATIADALAGRDIMGRAPTGSGKTLAFGIPLMARVSKSTPRNPRALVLAPTRELAEQISRELIPLGKTMGRWTLAVYGGVGYEFQRRNLNRGTDVLVATPGRLTDLIDQGSVSLSAIEIVVVDEADRMADMGFLPQVRILLDQTPDNRQTMLYSATLDGDIADLTKRYQRDPVRHEVQGAEDHHEASHYFWQVSAADRVGTTAKIVGSTTPTLVFTRTRRGADRLADQLGRHGVEAVAIHGGRSQSQRTRALAAFTRGRVDALVATDVAARGIHVSGVASVVHFDLPNDGKDYLHRSGRTARAGAGGVVVSLVANDQTGAARSIQRAVGLPQMWHDPATDWLTGTDGSRVGSVAPSPRSEQRQQRQQRRPSGGQRRSRARSGQGNAGYGRRSR